MSCFLCLFFVAACVANLSPIKGAHTREQVANLAVGSAFESGRDFCAPPLKASSWHASGKVAMAKLFYHNLGVLKIGPPSKWPVFLWLSFKP